MTREGKNRSSRSRQARWKRGWEGEGQFCHTVYGLFMNKLCVSLGHCCGLVTMASAVRGRRNADLLGNKDPWRGWGGRRVCFSHWSHSLASHRSCFSLIMSPSPSPALTFISAHTHTLSRHAVAALPAASPSVATVS